jgi:hypothetical protein
MGQETNQDQTNQVNLSKYYHSTDGYVVLDKAGWNRRVIKRDNQNIVELTPTAESLFNGTFIREEREIHHNPRDKTYTLKKYQLPSQGLACVLGSALVATAAYCWYWYSHGNSINN